MLKMSCSICNENVSSKEPKLCKCSYKFHVKCLREWYYHSQNNFNQINCPCCKRKIQIWKNTRNIEGRKKVIHTIHEKMKCINVDGDRHTNDDEKIIDLFEFIWKKRTYIRKDKPFYNCVKKKLDEMKDTKRFRKTYSKMKNF